jgi:hypothetical protein
MQKAECQRWPTARMCAESEKTDPTRSLIFSDTVGGYERVRILSRSHFTYDASHVRGLATLVPAH